MTNKILKIIYGIFAVIGMTIVATLIIGCFLSISYSNEEKQHIERNCADGNCYDNPVKCAEINGVIDEDGLCRTKFCDMILNDDICEKVFGDRNKSPCNDPLKVVICAANLKNDVKESVATKKIVLEFPDSKAK